MSMRDRPKADAEQTDNLPSVSEVEARFAAWRKEPLPPWLTPEGLAAAAEAAESGIAEISGHMDPGDPPVDND
jgi:hypothetical protein